MQSASHVWESLQVTSVCYSIACIGMTALSPKELTVCIIVVLGVIIISSIRKARYPMVCTWAAGLLVCVHFVGSTHAVRQSCPYWGHEGPQATHFFHACVYWQHRLNIQAAESQTGMPLPGPLLPTVGCGGHKWQWLRSACYCAVSSGLGIGSMHV
jgi:hypothetical protein